MPGVNQRQPLIPEITPNGDTKIAAPSALVDDKHDVPRA